MQKRTIDISPIGDRVLAEKVPSLTESHGVILPASAQNMQLEAYVLAVGPGKSLLNGTVVPMGVKVGDRIAYAQFAGNALTIQGRELIVLQQKDILCLVD